MKNLIVTILLPVVLLGQQANAGEVSNVAEVTGTLQQWIPGSRAISVAGKSHEMMDDVEFLTGDLQLLNRSSLKSGARVLLRITNGKVTHVIVNPTPASQFDQPNK